MIGRCFRKARSAVRKFNEMYDAVNCTERFVRYSEAARLAHPRVFERYRGRYSGRSVVLVACGPSVNYYEPLSGAVHIGVNRAFYKSEINFSQIFIHDRQTVEENVALLKEHGSEKFVAFHTSEANARRFNAPFWLTGEIGAKRFFVSDPDFKGVAGSRLDLLNPDIAAGMVMDRGGGTVMSALQFALFTSPARIYLVGCDCTDEGHFYDGGKKNDLHEVLPCLKSLWKEAAEFIKAFYPGMEVVSVNPAGLKGLFRDEYTQKYLEAQAS